MKLFLLSFVLLSVSTVAQVGIGTTSPQGSLDIVSSNNLGLVVPRVTSIEAVTDGQTNPPVNGTMVYDLSRAKTCFYTDDRWLCIGLDAYGHPEVTDESPVPFTTNDAYIKASNSNVSDYFGIWVSLSDDGARMAVGAYNERSNATGINGDQTNNDNASSGAVYVFDKIAGVWSQSAYIKASNSELGDRFGEFLDLSGDGNTLVVGAPYEDSVATGINGNQVDNTAVDSGAAYVFTFNSGTWSQQAYIKASNAEAGDYFGSSVSLNQNGSVLAISATYEASNATGVNGLQSDNSSVRAGAVYVFNRSGTVWTQSNYVKASNTDPADQFGMHLDLSGDGLTLVVATHLEDSVSPGINGDQTDNSGAFTGAAYVFANAAGVWSQQAYVKASNMDAGDNFGRAVCLSSNGDTLVVGASVEGSAATGVNGDQTDNSLSAAGAVYVFNRSGITWTQEAYIKASNPDSNDLFGRNVRLSDDGLTILAPAYRERSAATGINGDQLDNSAGDAGAAYVFRKEGGVWSQEAYVKAFNTDVSDQFGFCLDISADGNVLAIGAWGERSAATGVGGDQTDNTNFGFGAVYVYEE